MLQISNWAACCCSVRSANQVGVLSLSLCLSVSMWAQLQLQFVYMCSVCHSDSAPTLSFWMLFGDSFSSYVLESEFFVVRFSNWKNVAWSATVLGVACLLDQWRRLIKNCLL